MKARIKELIANYNYGVFTSDKGECNIAICEEFPSMKAHGDSPEKAIKELKIALEVALEWMIDDGEELPQPCSEIERPLKFRTRVKFYE